MDKNFYKIRKDQIKENGFVIVTDKAIYHCSETTPEAGERLWNIHIEYSNEPIRGTMQLIGNYANTYIAQWVFKHDNKK